MSSILPASMELTSLAVNADLNTLVETTPVKFVGGVDARYQCVSCSSTLRQPCQTPCGHRICRSCVDALFAAARGSRQVRCPGNEDDCVNLTRDTVSISANLHCRTHVLQYRFATQTLHCLASAVYSKHPSFVSRSPILYSHCFAFKLYWTLQ